MLDPPGISESERSHWTLPPHIYKIIKKNWPELAFFHIHFLESKVLIRLAMHRLVRAFVVPMYQRQISREKVHTIFKNSKLKLNVKIYTHNFPGVDAEGCIVFIFPYVPSSFPILKDFRNAPVIYSLSLPRS